MNIARAIDLQLQRRYRGQDDSRFRTSSRQSCCYGCVTDVLGSKCHAWALLIVLVLAASICMGLFEAMRLTTNVLRSPCTVVGSEVVDVGSCTLCDSDVPSNCEVHPVATARILVNFQHSHSNLNITGKVWYCKNRVSDDPCLSQLGFLDQLSLDSRKYSSLLPFGGPIPCTTAEILAYMQLHMRRGSQMTDCYYSSKDFTGEDVWLSMPSPGLVDHAWFQKHLEYPVFLALGGLVLLTVLLGCLAVEGAELWFSGIL